MILATWVFFYYICITISQKPVTMNHQFILHTSKGKDPNLISTIKFLFAFQGLKVRFEKEISISFSFFSTHYLEGYFICLWRRRILKQFQTYRQSIQIDIKKSYMSIRATWVLFTTIVLPVSKTQIANLIANQRIGFLTKMTLKRDF